MMAAKKTKTKYPRQLDAYDIVLTTTGTVIVGLAKKG